MFWRKSRCKCVMLTAKTGDNKMLQFDKTKLNKKVKHDALMQCGLIGVTYDFTDKTGCAWFPETHCCDMYGCIKWFKKIDENIRCILTFSGEYLDTCYYLSKESGDWGYVCYLDIKHDDSRLLLIMEQLHRLCDVLAVSA